MISILVQSKEIIPRPAFTSVGPAKSPHFDYETGYETDDAELKWYIEPHRWYGLLSLFMLGFVQSCSWARAAQAVTLGYKKWSDLATRFLRWQVRATSQQPGLSAQLTSDRFELEELSPKDPSNDDLPLPVTKMYDL